MSGCGMESHGLSGLLRLTGTAIYQLSRSLAIALRIAVTAHRDIARKYGSACFRTD